VRYFKESDVGGALTACTNIHEVLLCIVHLVQEGKVRWSNTYAAELSLLRLIGVPLYWLP
jgi:hypothetical protein